MLTFGQSLGTFALSHPGLFKELILALSFGGTVAGEHGVGNGKKEYMLEEHGDAYALMATLKRAIDPNNIMNPGKIVDIS